jgi:hypothetical protein
VGGLLWKEAGCEPHEVGRARAFMHVPGALRHKLDPVSKKGCFIEYEADAKAYQILRKQDNRVNSVIRRDRGQEGKGERAKERI